MLVFRKTLRTYQINDPLSVREKTVSKSILGGLQLMRENIFWSTLKSNIWAGFFEFLFNDILFICAQ